MSIYLKLVYIILNKYYQLEQLNKNENFFLDYYLYFSKRELI